MRSIGIGLISIIATQISMSAAVTPDDLTGYWYYAGRTSDNGVPEAPAQPRGRTVARSISEPDPHVIVRFHKHLMHTSETRGPKENTTYTILNHPHEDGFVIWSYNSDKKEAQIILGKLTDNILHLDGKAFVRMDPAHGKSH